MSKLDASGLEVLDRAECMRLLAASSFGRVAVTIGALPSIYPVNYRLVDERIVFTTGAGSKLAAALHGAIVAFEIDWTDPETREGWSVNVVGHATLDAGVAGHTLREVSGIETWLPRSAPFVVAVEATLVTGRRLVARRPGGDQARSDLADR